jgi:ATP-dependent exoDNAse (exonuclease V) beta subunit
MTVHKSKGLEFPIVIIPFDWEIAKPGSELWVDTKDKVSDLEVALIGNNKNVGYTDFSDDRDSEMKKALLDDINVLYVAFTRAKEQLYVFCSEPSKTNLKFNSLSMLLSYFLSNDELKSVYEFGKKEHYFQNKQRENIYKIDYSQTKNWKSKVQLKNSSSKLWSIDYDKQEWGSLLHSIFSEIHYSGQEDEVINRLQKNGLIDLQLKVKLITKIKEILNHKEFASFFSKDYEVKTEKGILTKDGETYIPDRILLKNNEVIVIDFKTGSDSNIEDHKNQITAYSNLLSEMGCNNIKMVLAYTELEKTVVL